MNHNPSINPVPPHATPDSFFEAGAWFAVVLGIVLLTGVWMPMRLRSRPLLERLHVLTSQIATQNRFRANSAIRADVAHSQAVENELRLMQSYWIDRRNTFMRHPGTTRPDPHQDEGRIDFKIALFTARTNLQALAHNQKAAIPDNLGIEETLSTDTRVETALGQLAATVRLVKRVMNADISSINRIQPWPPRMKALQDDTHDRLREYPVSIQADAGFESCLSLLTHLADPDNGYALEHLSIEKSMFPEPGSGLSLQFMATAGRPLRRRMSSGPDDTPEPVSSTEKTDASGRNRKRPAPGDTNGTRSGTNAWTQEVEQ